MEGVEDKRHERFELREEVFPADSGEFSESGHDAGGDGGREVARFRKEDVEHGDDVGASETLRSANE
jgi:hypothetical protein